MSNETGISLRDMQAQIAKMQSAMEALAAENAALKAAGPARSVSLKVGESGTLCLYHGARYPIALYVEQWERILPFLRSGKLEEFAKANAHLLKRKG